MAIDKDFFYHLVCRLCVAKKSMKDFHVWWNVNVIMLILSYVCAVECTCILLTTTALSSALNDIKKSYCT